MGFSQGGGGSGSLGSSSDVALNSPQNSQTLSWDSGVGKWRNITPYSGLNVTDIKRADYTAAPNEFVIVDTETPAQNIEITLPNAPANNTQIAVKLFRATGGIGINASGDDYFDTVLGYGGGPPPSNYPAQGGTQRATFTYAGQAAIFQYHSATKYWYMLSMDDHYASYLQQSDSFASLYEVPTAYTDAINSAVTTAASTPQTSRVVTSYNSIQTQDVGNIIEVDAASPVSLVLNDMGQSIKENSTVEIFQKGTGQATVDPYGLVTIHSSVGLKTRAQWSSMTIRKMPSHATTFPTSGMAMRLKADDITGANGSLVSAWPDSSGNSLPDATQTVTGNKPTLNTSGLNGHKTVDFGASSNTFLSLSGAALDLLKNKAAVSIFVALKMPNNLTGDGTLLFFSKGTSATQSRLELKRYSGQSLAYTNNRFDAGNATPQAFYSPNITQGSLLDVQQYYAHNSASYYLEGQNNGGFASGPGGWDNLNSSNTSSLAATIGSTGAGASGWWQGSIAEILVYDRMLSTDERYTVNKYFKDTYGLQFGLSGLSQEWVITGDATT